MRAVDQIGHGWPDTLPAAHAEIRRLRELARDWLAFGGEVERSDQQALVRTLTFELSQKVDTLDRKCQARTAARLLIAMSMRPERVWPRETLLQHALALRCNRVDLDDDEKSYAMLNVLVSHARFFLKQVGYPDGIETVWAQGYLIRADAVAEVLKLAGVAQGGGA